jgi:hypothetical protein
MTRIFGVGSPHTAAENEQRDLNFEVIVLYTTAAAAECALRSAARLADGLSAQVRMLVPCVVPYPLPLDQPDVRPKVLSRSLCDLVLAAEVDCEIDIRLCREPWQAIKQALPARSLVVIGAKPRWWQIRGWLQDRQLRQHGHHIAYAEEGQSHA